MLKNTCFKTVKCECGEFLEMYDNQPITCLNCQTLIKTQSGASNKQTNTKKYLNTHRHLIQLNSFSVRFVQPLV
jgi:hypothetical protein